MFYKSMMTAVAALTLSAGLAFAEGSYTKGTVKKVNADSGKVMIEHEDLVNLGMPGMTMVFRADKKIIARMKPGQDIEFIAGKENGKLVVVELKK